MAARSSALAALQASSPSPSAIYFVVRENGDLVPLLAADELPIEVSLQRLPRVFSGLSDTVGMINLGLVPRSGRYELDNPVTYVRPAMIMPSPSSSPPVTTLASSTREHSQIAETQMVTWRPRTHSSAFETRDMVQRAGQARDKSSASSGVENAPPTGATAGRAQQKTYCTHWLFHGECAFTHSPRGCKFKHEMPQDPETMAEVGLKALPKWWTDRRKHSAGEAFWRQKGAGSKSGRKKLAAASMPARVSPASHGWESADAASAADDLASDATSSALVRQASLPATPADRGSSPGKARHGRMRAFASADRPGHRRAGEAAGHASAERRSAPAPAYKEPIIDLDRVIASGLARRRFMASSLPQQAHEDRSRSPSASVVSQPGTNGTSPPETGPEAQRSIKDGASPGASSSDAAARRRGARSPGGVDDVPPPESMLLGRDGGVLVNRQGLAGAVGTGEMVIRPKLGFQHIDGAMDPFEDLLDLEYSRDA